MWNDVKSKEAIYQCYACRVLLLVKKLLLINRADAPHIDLRQIELQIHALLYWAPN